eukprot:TRINITY_DN2127_c0_g1_i5.p2 TRINITY_DN2127_c0_g1~~TRINITY_DN2127_c0_g1_i5.p2  ORF type:complete len:263 (-),score=55.49 TRINITY_DN2127_c0_g1_i5:156-944(-)
MAWFGAPPPGAAVFITGCDTGIGRSTALHLARRGFRVFAGVLSAAAGAALQQEAGQIVPLVCDVTKEDEVAAAAAAIRGAVGAAGLWGVVNNAGINSCNGPVEFLPMPRIRQTFEVNFFAIYTVLRHMLPLVRVARGRIVNVSSVNGIFLTWIDHSAYAASKFAVVGLSDSLRLELRRFGIPVSVIHPGPRGHMIASNIWEDSVLQSVKCWEEMGPACASIYGESVPLEERLALAKKLHAQLSDPDVVARAIEHARKSRWPN